MEYNLVRSRPKGFWRTIVPHCLLFSSRVGITVQPKGNVNGIRSICEHQTNKFVQNISSHTRMIFAKAVKFAKLLNTAQMRLPQRKNDFTLFAERARNN